MYAKAPPRTRRPCRRCPKKHVASVKTALRKAWEFDEATEVDRLIRDLAKRMEKEAPGVCRSLLEGLDEILTVKSATARAAPDIGLHQRHRERTRHDALRDPQHEALAKRRDGAPLGSRDDGSKGGHPAIESAPALRRALSEQQAGGSQAMSCALP